MDPSKEFCSVDEHLALVKLLQCTVFFAKTEVLKTKLISFHRKHYFLPLALGTEKRETERQVDGYQEVDRQTGQPQGPASLPGPWGGGGGAG